ncbi:hypothetical protein LSAT2_001628 [Lamellibrachia satsuma]|nr:hypothetical protein LSAT2_001628 [Lamellibrachia satsuma]
MRALKDHDLPSAIDDDVLQLHESTFESLYPVQVVPEPRTFAEDRSDDALITSEDFAFVEEELLGNTKSACGSAVNEVPISVAKEQLLSNPASLVYSEKPASHKSSLPSVTTSRESLTQLRKLRSPSGELQLRSVKYAVSRGIAGMNSSCRSRPQSSHSSALPTSVSRPRSSLSRHSPTDQHLSARPLPAKCAPTERQRGGVWSGLSQPKAQRVSSDSRGVSVVDGAPASTPGKPAASDNRRRLSSGTKLPRACGIGTVTTVPHCITYSRKRVDQSLATPGADAISKIPTKKPDQNKNKNPTVDRADDWTTKATEQGEQEQDQVKELQVEEQSEQEKDQVKGLQVEEQGEQDQDQVKELQVEEQGEQEQDQVKGLQVEGQGEQDQDQVKELQVEEQGEQDQDQVKELQVEEQGEQEQDQVKGLQVEEQGEQDQDQVKELQVEEQGEQEQDQVKAQHVEEQGEQEQNQVKALQVEEQGEQEQDQVKGQHVEEQGEQDQNQVKELQVEEQGEQEQDQVKGQHVEEQGEQEQDQVKGVQVEEQGEQEQDQVKGQHAEETHGEIEQNVQVQQEQLQELQEKGKHDEQEKEDEEKQEKEQLEQGRVDKEQQEQEQPIDQEQREQQKEEEEITSKQPVEDQPQPIQQVEPTPQPPPPAAADTKYQPLCPDEDREDMPRSNSPQPQPQHKFESNDETVQQYRGKELLVIGPEDAIDSSDLESVATKDDSLESLRAPAAMPPSVGRRSDPFPLYEASVFDSLYEMEYTPPTWRPHSIDWPGTVPLPKGSPTSTDGPADIPRHTEASVPTGMPKISEGPENAAEIKQPAERAGDPVPTGMPNISEGPENAADIKQPPERAGDVAENEEGVKGEQPPESAGDVAEIVECDDPNCHYTKGHECPCQPLDLTQVMSADIGQRTSEELLARVVRQAIYPVDVSDLSQEPSAQSSNRNRWSM